ncbi:MmcQ/YjbR family DNA-binding protein [Georgenia sp. TF02-10]|uniref:MmcQ/YjbR family DNA-binding protein n=1 Tax=Georgenia sp. TF02-10 TaxID=2917725 RepID=UPI001FA705B8|nr:MmcQ/YjbR family DNA-binding protein [Georgenia sp. TF02-10]UNX55627.1 MmcQ/YjbR family DNA-binding protein [Georgenia sp. TF02-10]
MATWEDVVAIASKLPRVEESTWNRSAPSLTVAGRSFARLRTEAEGALVLMCDLSEKEALLATKDPAFFTTPHYDNHGSILVQLDLVDQDQLAELVVDAWRITAPVRLRRDWELRHLM